MASFDTGATLAEVAGMADSVSYNETSWGPLNGTEVSKFSDVPYAHFDKRMFIGRCADFTTGSQYGQYGTQQQQQKPYMRRVGENAEFAFKHDSAEDNSFSLVDTAKAPVRRTGGRGAQQRQWQQSGRGNIGGRFGQAGGRAGQGRSEGGRFGRGGREGRGGRGGGGRFGNRRQERKERLPSLTVDVDWQTVHEFDASQLLKLQANAPAVEDLLWAGQLDTYDESYDKLTVRTSRKLQSAREKIFYSVTTAEDPVLEKLAVEGAGDVYATDAIISQLMAAPRSVYSWDLVVQKMDGIIYIDKRDNSAFDYLTVNETARDPPQDVEGQEEYNGPEKLSLEATMINQNFSQQVLKPGNAKVYEPNPFFEEDEPGVSPSSTAYRYRRFDLGGVKLVVRCELHAWMSKKGEDQYYNVFSLNEWDSKGSGINWRQKVDGQRGAVLATELKNNSCKVAKWTAQSVLSGADQMKLGYVSRVSPSTPFDHQVLAADKFRPKDLAAQINLSVQNMWGIVKMVCELLMSKENGKYVLLKDPNKQTIRVYSVPLNTFEEPEEEPMEALLEESDLAEA